MTSYRLINDKVMERCIDEIRRSHGMEVTIKKPVRSAASNRYYWAIMNIVARDIGEDAENLHSMLKLRVLGPQIITVRGEQLTIPKHSKDLNQADFGKLIDAVQMLAVSMGIKVPAPEYYGIEI